MILTFESFPTHLFTRRTVARATFLIARMFPTVANLFTFHVTGKLLRALNLLLLCSASARLCYHLQAGRTVSTMTPFCAVVAFTGEQFAARISAGRSGLCAGQAVVGLPARTVSDQRQRTGWTLTFSMTNVVTGMKTA